MFHIYIAIACAYVLWRFVHPLPWSARARLALGVVLVLISSKRLVYIALFGNMYSPELPFGVVVTMGWLWCAFALLFVIQLASDIGLLFARLFVRKACLAFAAGKLRYVGAVVALVLAGFGVSQAIAVPEVRRVELQIPGLPSELDGFRLVQLTDLHISRMFPASWVEQVVQRTNALDADLIVVTGDVIDGTTAARENDVRPLGDLRARLGVIASPGNHEYYFGLKEWVGKLESLGMRVLVNSHEIVDTGRGPLAIVGVADTVALRYGLDGPDIARATQGIDGGVVKILLSHRPVDTQPHADAGVALQLSGHTHGGMILVFDQVVRNANYGFVSGLYAIGGMQLYLSNGTGLWNGFPIRLGVASEITELVLRTPR